MRPGGNFFAGIVGLLLAVSWAWAAPVADERILSAAELVAMEREDGMWRVVQVDEDMTVCLVRLRAAGYTEAEVSAFRPRLAEIWETAAERNLGWLQAETVQKIKEVDREFVARMRAARLRASAGLATKGYARESELRVNERWRRAILRLLDYDEIAEFRLMNSAAAREASRLLQEIPITADEQRVLFQGERDFARDYGLAPFEVSRADWRERAAAQLDHYAAVREVLGADRFVIYLARAAPDFAAMEEALGGSPPLSTSAVLDMWWLRKRRDLAFGKEGFRTPRECQKMTAQLRDSAVKLLGEDRFVAYVRREDAGWLR